MATTQAGMKVAFSRINKQLDANGYDSVWLLVKATGVKGSPDDLMADVDAAIEAANQALTRGNDELVWAGGGMPSVKGPMVDLDWVGEPEQNTEWLTVFADTLTAAGRSGTVTAPGDTYIPADAQNALRGAVPTAHLAFTLSDPRTYGYPPFTWLVDEAPTRALAEHAAIWVRQDRTVTTYLREGSARLAVDDDGQLADPFEQIIHRSAYGAIETLTRPPYTRRSVRVAPLGTAIYTTSGASQSWRDYIPGLVDALRAHGHALDVAFIRYRESSAVTFDLSSTRPAPPGNGDPDSPSSEYDRNRHVYAAYVADAHAVQVLTASHLEKATDLSAWDVEHLGNDRYLVQARDLDPWFDAVPSDVDNERLYHDLPPEPDPDVLAQARHDFGAMILTHDVLVNDPHAWTREGGKGSRPINVHPRPVWIPRSRRGRQ